jgi:adenine-specific DNA-methyltransferase
MPATTARTTEPVARTSADLTPERLADLRRLFPDVFVEGKVDFDKLRSVLGDALAGGPERFTFSWAGRSDAVATLQTPSRGHRQRAHSARDCQAE